MPELYYEVEDELVKELRTSDVLPLIQEAKDNKNFKPETRVKIKEELKSRFRVDHLALLALPQINREPFFAGQPIIYLTREQAEALWIVGQQHTFLE